MRKKVLVINFVIMLLLSSTMISGISIKQKDENIENSNLIEIQKKFDFKQRNNSINANFLKIKSIIKAPSQNDASKNNNIKPKMQSMGTSTIFSAPYSSCYSWGDAINLIDEYSHGCNQYSGSIGSYANAWIGGATAEAMQSLNIYVGRQKTLNVDAKIVKTGGKCVFGIGAFSGTEKTWSWDDFIDNYHRSDLEPWLTWDIIILKIISIVSLFVGSVPSDIAQAISMLSSIVDFEGLALQLDEMLKDGDAEIIHISFNFNANPGHHTLWVGTRATASACITGTASAVSFGQVQEIIIDGISAPQAPTVIGPNSGTTNNNYKFCTQSSDPNNDKIRYQFDWGDGTQSQWTAYQPSSNSICKNHAYAKEGLYNITVIAEDIDKMQSRTTFEFIVGEQTPPTKPILNGKTNVDYLDDYTLNIVSSDAQGDNIIYQIDWGDGVVEQYGPYLSGLEKNIKHPYYSQGMYTIRARATDEICGWSDWENMDINLPREKNNMINPIDFLISNFSIFTKLKSINLITLN